MKIFCEKQYEMNLVLKLRRRGVLKGCNFSELPDSFAPILKGTFNEESTNYFPANFSACIASGVLQGEKSPDLDLSWLWDLKYARRYIFLSF